MLYSAFALGKDLQFAERTVDCFIVALVRIGQRYLAIVGAVGDQERDAIFSTTPTNEIFGA